MNAAPEIAKDESKGAFALIKESRTNFQPVWSKIGTVSYDQDGTLRVSLTTIPANGEIQIPDIWEKPNPLTAVSQNLKRLIDITVAWLLLVMLGPLLAVLSIIILLESPGAPMYVQWRMGRNLKPFKLYKLRTMIKNAHIFQSHLSHKNEADGITFKMKNDPRVTRFGRFLRQMRLDELPQLWNVIRGDMSLVGPRPFDIDEFNKSYSPIQGFHEWVAKRHQVRPGITGPWQVGGGNDLSFSELVLLDTDYVDHWNLSNDFKFLIRTIPVVIGGRGAY